jgi:hypothetical protein
VVIGLAILLIVFVLGACELFGQAYSVAMRFAPTWERLQARADTLWATYNAENGSTDDAQFRARFAASHSVATQQDLDNASKAGYPLVGVGRDDVRRAGLSNMPKIAAAFEEAATRSPSTPDPTPRRPETANRRRPRT